MTTYFTTEIILKCYYCFMFKFMLTTAYYILQDDNSTLHTPKDNDCTMPRTDSRESNSWAKQHA